MDSNSKFKPSFRDMILCQCKEFVYLTHYVIFDFFFVNFNNFPIGSLIKKTTILGLSSQFSSILNYFYEWSLWMKYKPNGYQTLKNNHLNHIRMCRIRSNAVFTLRRNMTRHVYLLTFKNRLYNVFPMIFLFGDCVTI